MKIIDISDKCLVCGNYHRDCKCISDRCKGYIKRIEARNKLLLNIITRAMDHGPTADYYLEGAMEALDNERS